MKKLVLCISLLAISLFAQDKNVPVQMAGYKIVIKDLGSKKDLTLDFNEKTLKFTGELDPKKAYDILTGTIAFEMSKANQAIDSLITVNKYLETRLMQERK